MIRLRCFSKGAVYFFFSTIIHWIVIYPTQLPRNYLTFRSPSVPEKCHFVSCIYFLDIQISSINEVILSRLKLSNFVKTPRCNFLNQFNKIESLHNGHLGERGKWSLKNVQLERWPLWGSRDPIWHQFWGCNISI